MLKVVAPGNLRRALRVGGDSLNTTINRVLRRARDA
jgi:hypothetical protein